jgi:Protein of unknown function (DUF998)
MTTSPSATPRPLATPGPGHHPTPWSAEAVRTRWLVACGAVAGPLFVAAVLAQAVTRPGFSLTRDAASLLDDGPWGWVQSANFIVTGLLLAVAAAGLRHALPNGRGSRWAPRLLLITGVGLVGGGIFHPDPSGGYPPGTTPGASAVSSWHGVLHQVCGSAAFAALIMFCVILARRYRTLGQPRMAACSWLAGVLCAAGVATGGMPRGTLTLFIGVSIALLWAAAIAARLATAHDSP